jgi:hypothetical protein
VLAELIVMQSAQLVGVVIQPVGSVLHLVEVVAVLTRGRLLLAALADYPEFLSAQLGDLGQRLLKSHAGSSAVWFLAHQIEYSKQPSPAAGRSSQRNAPPFGARFILIY